MGTGGIVGMSALWWRVAEVAPPEANLSRWERCEAGRRMARSPRMANRIKRDQSQHDRRAHVP